VQLDVSYGRNKGTTVAAFAGELIASAPGWSVYARDLGGLVRVLGFNGSAQGLPGGAGSIVVLELAGAKGKSAKLESIKLVDGTGNEIPVQMAPDKPGAGKGRK
jgi:hypothetical protein